MSMLRTAAEDASQAASPVETTPPKAPVETVQLLAPAKAGIARHEAWRKRPVTPRADLGETFPPWPTLDELLACARLQREAGCPDATWQPFASMRDQVQGAVDDPAGATQALTDAAAPSVKRCERPDAYRVVDRWPTGHWVNDLANMLGRVGNRSDATLDDWAHGLAQALEAVLRWSRGQKARAARPGAIAATSDETIEPKTAITAFNPITFGRDR